MLKPVAFGKRSTSTFVWRYTFLEDGTVQQSNDVSSATYTTFKGKPHKLDELFVIDRSLFDKYFGEWYV